ncbi:restriction endonuclease subunit S [Bradyrhizobium sp. USDA 3458]|uniref:restriction endonuclease subunit S n=1 Tax=Bradyrhizobium sp. USDA 3458 TaxID=2591461 RepID=UPI00114417B9|nr:restriction endonuclease subunit S [Bradyrhizobium sp. USDA 3458]
MTSAWPSKTLAEVCEIKPPKSEAKRKLKDSDVVSFVPMEDLGIDQKFLEPKTERKLGQVAGSYTFFADGDVLLAKITPCFENGKLGIARGLTNGIGFGSSEYIVFRPAANLCNEYLYYFLLQDKFRADGIKTMSGAVGHKRVTKEFIERCQIPLPPFPEQQRIVAILDEAFAGLAIATANAEKNLTNAREVFDSYLNSVFNQTKSLNFVEADRAKVTTNWTGAWKLGDVGSTRTGGRDATTRHIEGRRSLCVGMPKSEPRGGWAWRPLDGLARMESGHTPSRRHPEYWGGDIPWIGIRDAKAAHGREVFETLENTNKLGLENSSARLLPAQTVCLSRTASVGYVTVMGRPMATSQDFVNWVCSEELLPRFLMYLFLAQGDEIFKFSSGAVHQTIYFPEAKAFHICLPSMNDQYQIVEALDALREQAERLEAHYDRKLGDLAEMKQSILQKALTGNLSSPPSQAIEEAAE